MVFFTWKWALFFKALANMKEHVSIGDESCGLLLPILFSSSSSSGIIHTHYAYWHILHGPMTCLVASLGTLITGWTNRTVCYLKHSWNCYYMNISKHVHIPCTSTGTNSEKAVKQIHVTQNYLWNYILQYWPQEPDILHTSPPKFVISSTPSSFIQ